MTVERSEQSALEALEVARAALGLCHLVEEGPNAGWVTTSSDEEAEGWQGYYEDDYQCRADCPVCVAARKIDEVLS